MKKRNLAYSLVAALALIAPAAATHVEPMRIPGPDGNMTCSDFEPEDEDWKELKIDPAVDGTYVSADGMLKVQVDFHDNSEGEPKTFDWVALVGSVDAVFVKAGNSEKNGGHNLYEYDPAATADTGLRSPRDEDKNAISHVSFCYEAGDDVSCEDDPEQEKCQVDCEDTPRHPDCIDEKECPEIVLRGRANEDGSITVHVGTEAEFDLFRTAGDGAPMLIGSFNGTTQYEDTNTTAGTTYTYIVVVDDQRCERIEVTAIPVFPSVVAATAAIGLGTLAYAGMRRRR